ncbi:MAG: hypothetical protein EZS28_055257 [Streblomastix strix]|uniref:Uncharacterized protein n=1 Tax=Streblomastix strix TaxID=222440 RepID=A0A5J4Q408_9EUKA|nr:MAG: hypothetical protein EZS28_055257 [Streblomastix strix]
MITIAGGWFALAVRIVLFLYPLVLRNQIQATNVWINNFNYRALLERKYAPAAVAGATYANNRRFTEQDNYSNSGQKHNRKETRQVIYQNRASEDEDNDISD